MVTVMTSFSSGNIKQQSQGARVHRVYVGIRHPRIARHHVSLQPTSGKQQSQGVGGHRVCVGIRHPFEKLSFQNVFRAKSSVKLHNVRARFCVYVGMCSSI